MSLREKLRAVEQMLHDIKRELEQDSQQIEPGNWYLFKQHDNDYAPVIYIQDEKGRHYGWNYAGNWVSSSRKEDWGGLLGGNFERMKRQVERLASTEEVRTRLVSEIKKRYDVGDTITTVLPAGGVAIREWGLGQYFEHDIIIEHEIPSVRLGGNIYLFHAGEWAETHNGPQPNFKIDDYTPVIEWKEKRIKIGCKYVSFDELRAIKKVLERTESHWTTPKGDLATKRVKELYEMIE